MKNGMNETAHSGAMAGAALLAAAALGERQFAPVFHFDVRCLSPAEERRAELNALNERMMELRSGSKLRQAFRWRELSKLEHMAEGIPLAPAWDEQFHNVVTTVGKNDLLDKYFAGSAYTAAWYVGMITSTSYSTGVVAGDTMATHGGWLEGGGTNAPLYTSGTRPVLNMASAAAAGVKSTSAVTAFTVVTTGGTWKGAFIVSNSTKDGTTGILYSGGTFTGGDRTVSPADVVNVSGSFTIT